MSAAALTHEDGHGPNAALSSPVRFADAHGRLKTIAEDRAVDLLTLLADRGQHRAPPVSDLIIAAIAESAGLVVLHDDKDFDLIADVTGQPVQRLEG